MSEWRGTNSLGRFPFLCSGIWAYIQENLKKNNVQVFQHDYSKNKEEYCIYPGPLVM